MSVKAGRSNSARALVMGAAEDLPVANGCLGRQIQDQRGRDGRDEHFQAAETGLPRLRPTQAKILAADRGAPAPLIDDRLETKTGKAIGQLVQATFDMLGKLADGPASAVAATPSRSRPAGLPPPPGHCPAAGRVQLRVRVVPENPWRRRNVVYSNISVRDFTGHPRPAGFAGQATAHPAWLTRIQRVQAKVAAAIRGSRRQHSPLPSRQSQSAARQALWPQELQGHPLRPGPGSCPAPASDRAFSYPAPSGRYGRFLVVRLGLEELHQVTEGPHGLLALLHGIGDRDQRFGFALVLMRAALSRTLRPRSSRGRTAITARRSSRRFAAWRSRRLRPAAPALLRSTGMLRPSALIGPAALRTPALWPAALRPSALLCRLTTAAGRGVHPADLRRCAAGDRHVAPPSAPGRLAAACGLPAGQGAPFAAAPDDAAARSRDGPSSRIPAAAPCRPPSPRP